ncbi:MAG TPA: hypothetical protein VGK40_07665 [Verrucomicrobiae bacterium]|jgi:hypothetical protein
MKRHSIKLLDCSRRLPRRAVCAWIAGGLLALPVAGLAAYLPMIGPAPLRFQAPPRVATASPPALIPDTDPETEPNSTAAALPSGTNATPAQLEPIVSVAKSPDPIDVTNAPPAFTGPADANLITPQMMMHFFPRQLGDTNGVDTGLLLPFVFSPPVPASRTPSKATYSTP